MSISAFQPLRGREIVLGVTAGIAAYKAAELVRLLVKADAGVQVVMTERAQYFVGPLTFQALTGRPVFTDLFSLTQENEIGHIEIADAADLVIVAPATADVIARLASGLAGDAVTAMILASRAPLLLAPSMNVNMWQNPITQGNVRKLVETAGAAVVGPGQGFLACRWTGPGRLAEPADIVEAAARMLTAQDLAGRQLVISAGPTREAIDPMRFVSNRSSGKMGFALAAAAARRGAAVTLIAGPVTLDTPPGVVRVDVVSARDMQKRVADCAGSADAIIMAAAVADYRPREKAEQKLKKGGMAAVEVAIALEVNPDILLQLGEARHRRNTARPVLVGFAAETENAIDYARHKLEHKRCDLVVANDVSQPDAGFAVDTNRVALVSEAGVEHLELASKGEIAHRILDRVAERLGNDLST